MTLPQLSLVVVGAEYPNKRGPTRRFEIRLCLPGEPVELRREPSNPADSRAIGVYSMRDVQLGYLSAERAAWFNAMFERGQTAKAIFQREDTWGAVIRVAFDGEEPVLPPPPAPKPAPYVEEERFDDWPPVEGPDWGA